MDKKRLGDILIEAGIISHQQLTRALEVQKLTKKRLGTVLVELGYVRERVMLGFLANQFKLKTVHLDECEPLHLDNFEQRWDYLVSLFERTVAVPLEFDENNNLVVAIADPTDIEALDTLRSALGYNIKPVLATEKEIKQTINIYYRRLLR